jgi:hypothetical membrane protein
MTEPGARPRPAPSRVITRIGGIAAVIAALSYSSFLASPWTHSAGSASSGFVSELETPGQPYAWLYRSSDVLAGIGILLAAWAVSRLIAGRRWSAGATALLALTGFSSVLDGATTMRCDPGTSTRCAHGEHTAVGLIGQLSALHTDSGLLGFAASAAGAIILGAVLADRWPGWGRLQIAAGIGMAGCGVADLFLLLASSSIGSTERARVLLISGWFLIIGLFLLRQAAAAGARAAPGQPRDSPPDQRPDVERRRHAKRSAARTRPV